MDSRANIITTMGIISNEVYDESYFKNDAIENHKKISGTNYTVIDYESTSITDFQALLLQEDNTNNYVIAFRGTSSFTDGLVDFVIAGHYNAQYSAAVDFVNRALSNQDYNI